MAPACSPQPTRTPHVRRAQSPKLPHEIHRRSLWQALGIYLAASWGAPQVVGTVVETANLPEWLPGMALVLSIIGLPVASGRRSSKAERSLLAQHWSHRRKARSRATAERLRAVGHRGNAASAPNRRPSA